MLVGHTITKKDLGPIKLTVGQEVVEIEVSWHKTSASKVCLTVKASKEVDVIFPRTMTKFLERIRFLENELKLAEEFVETQKKIFLEEFEKLKGINE